MAASPLLLLLLLIAGISDGERSGDGLQTRRLHTRRTEGEAAPKTGSELDGDFQLKWMYNSPMKRDTMAKAAGVNNIAVDPLFLDLDNIDKFNDISFSEDQTPFPIDVEEKTTRGPVVIGVDEQGRSILRFVSNWQTELETTQSTTRATTTTTESTTTETTTTPTTTTTTTPSTTTTTEAPTTTTTAAATTQETTESTTTIPSTTAAFEIIPTISSLFDINNGLEDISPETSQPATSSFVQETPNPEDNIWWTPKPSFLGMSSIVELENRDGRREEETRDWQPLWKVTTETTTEPTTTAATTVSTTTTEPTTTTQEIQREHGPNRFYSRLRKVAEQSVLNDLELIAGSMNMNELVSELKGEQKLPQVIDPEQTEMALAMKRKTLAQLEILNRLADRKEELEQLINVQRKILLRARGSRTNIIVGQTEEEAEIQVPSANEVEDQGLTLPFVTTTPPRTTMPFTFPTTAAQKRRHLKKRKEYAPRQRRQRQKELRHFVAIPPRGPIVEEVKALPSAGELAHQLEREMRQAQRDVLTEEMRQFCSQALCTFEKGDTCRFETSYDEVTRRRQLRRRITREAPLYVIRSWSNWVGQPSASSHRVDRAPHFSARSTRFAAVFLEPQQLASLSISIPIRSSLTIRFRGWEASSGVRLRVCCDNYCPFSTEIGRSSRQWRRLSATCPADTRQLAFECENMGGRKGVCGVDDVFIAADGCPKLFDGPIDP